MARTACVTFDSYDTTLKHHRENFVCCRADIVDEMEVAQRRLSARSMRLSQAGVRRVRRQIRQWRRNLHARWNGPPA